MAQSGMGQGTTGAETGQAGFRPVLLDAVNFLLADVRDAWRNVQGIGVSLSGLAAGVVVDHLGYSAAFLVSSANALAALFFAMPEAAPGRSVPAIMAS